MVKLPPAPKLKQIQGDARVLHALDRLTFGPRPGDVEEIKAIGLDAWIASNCIPRPSKIPRSSSVWNNFRPCI